MRFFRPLVITFFIIFSFGGAWGQTTVQNTDDSGVGIHGYDPVSYHLSGPLQGSEELSSTFDGVTYYFADSDNLQMFKQRPEKYIPALGGWCAWAMLNGEKVDVDPERYKVIKGSTYLYYNTFFVDTLKKWEKLAETKTEEALVSSAEQHWAEIVNHTGSK